MRPKRKKKRKPRTKLKPRNPYALDALSRKAERFSDKKKQESKDRCRQPITEE